MILKMIRELKFKFKFLAQEHGDRCRIRNVVSRFRQKHLQTFIVYRWATPSELNAILMTGNTQLFADERSDKGVLNVKLRGD